MKYNLEICYIPVLWFLINIVMNTFFSSHLNVSFSNVKVFFAFEDIGLKLDSLMYYDGFLINIVRNKFFFF